MNQRRAEPIQSREVTEDGTKPVRPTPQRVAKGLVFPNLPDRSQRARPWTSATTVFDTYLMSDPPLISMKQWRAADKFCRIYFLAHGSPWQTQSWAGRISGSHDDMPTTQLAARQQLDVIAKRMTDRLYAVLRDVCGLHQAASTWARNRGLNPTVGIPLLQDALELYAMHAGIQEE